MPEPMTAERLAEISRHYDGLAEDAYSRNHAATHAAELLAEVKRLNERLAEYVGWEPTVKEEYEHACDVGERARTVVKRFEAGNFRGEVDPFLAALKYALEMQ